MPSLSSLNTFLELVSGSDSSMIRSIDLIACFLVLFGLVAVNCSPIDSGTQSRAGTVIVGYMYIDGEIPGLKVSSFRYATPFGERMSYVPFHQEQLDNSKQVSIQGFPSGTGDIIYMPPICSTPLFTPPANHPYTYVVRISKSSLPSLFLMFIM